MNPFQWLIIWFQERQLATTFPPTVEEHSTLPGQRLTRWECDFIGDHLNSGNCCPDCRAGFFLEGPGAGVCTNVKCCNPSCGSEFNLSCFYGSLDGDRLTPPSPLGRKNRG